MTEGTTGPSPTYRQRRPSGAAMRFDDAEPLTVVMVRHGETAMTQDKKLSGSSEPGPPLAPAGLEQARRAAEAVAAIGETLWPDVPAPSSVVASPMVRTQQTAGVIGERLGLPVATDPAFAECDFGEWQGRAPADLERDWPGELERWYGAEGRAPGGESLHDVGARVTAGIDGLLGAGTARTVVVVSHVMAIRAAVGVSLGTPTTSWTRLRVLPGSLTVLQWWPDGVRELVTAGLPTDR